MRALGIGHTTGMTRVLIAVDDSETSISAARAAHRLFGDDADYIVLNVSPNPVVWGEDAYQFGQVYPVAMPMAGVDSGFPFAIRPPGGAEPGAPIDRAAEAAHTAEGVATAAGLGDATPIGDTGDAAHAIVTAAINHDADVIVIGSHDRSWFSRLVMPSVSGFVLRESNVPVLLAR